MTQSTNEAPSSKLVTDEQNYWQSFYAKFDVDVPSQFCVMVATEADKAMPVVEFGCGNGRDAIYLASHKFKVFGTDLSEIAINRNKEKNQPASFAVCDVSKPDQVKGVIERARESAAGQDNKNITFYNRFFIHTLDDAQEKAFLDALSSAAIPGDKLYMEFRCSKDAAVKHVYGENHYRRYVDTEKLVEYLSKELGFEVGYNITGQGMAKYKSEDPFVSRIAAEKR